MNNEQITEIYYRHVDMIYRLCFTYLKNKADTDDIVQNVFVKLMGYRKKFQSAEHEKAWLIRVAINLCKDSFKRKVCEELDESVQANADVDETLRVVLDLPSKFKAVIYLYYYEGYSCPEIAEMLGQNASTVRSYLSEGRLLLRNLL